LVSIDRVRVFALARSFAAASALLASVAYGQGSSVLTGTVIDAATKKTVPDVAVTATSAALQGEQIVVTDASGQYRISQLPPGAYTIRLERETYRPFSRGDIQVRADRTIRVNVELLPEAIKAEEIVVVGRAPTVDVGSTTTGFNVGKEFVSSVPFIRPNSAGVRSYDSLASVAPQVVADDKGFGISGTTSPENLILVDGLSVTDPAYGVNGSPFPIEFVEEANVITGGYMAEYGRATGGVMNVVTKSGSNEFHGSVFGNWTPGLLSNESPEIKSEAAIFRNKSRLWNSGDFGAEIGGPILKDKLWFFAGFSPSFDRTQDERSLSRFQLETLPDGTQVQALDEVGNRIPIPLAGTTKTRFVDSRSFSYIGKLTYLISPDQNVSLSVLGSPRSTVVPQSFGNRMAGTFNTLDSRDVSLKYQASFFEKHLLVDATAGWHHQVDNQLPNDGSGIGSTTGAASAPEIYFRRENPHSILDFESLPMEAAVFCEPAGSDNALACPATSPGNEYAIGGAGWMQNATLDRFQGRLALTYLLNNVTGHHVIKAGADIEHLNYDITKAYSGGVILREGLYGTSYREFRQFAVLTGPDTFEQLVSVKSNPSALGIGSFVQDSWNVLDLFSINLGLRYENQQLINSEGQVGMSLNNMLSPRVGFIYDFTQQGRSKVYGSYARYYESVPIDIADRSLSGENQAAYIYSEGPNCNLAKDPSQASTTCKDSSNKISVARTSDPSQYALTTGQGKSPVDPALQPQSTDEIVVGADYEVMPDGRMGVYYTKRYLNQVIEDMSNDEGNTLFIGNPGSGIGSAFPKAVRDYDAVTIYFAKVFSDFWQAQASYTYSSLRGNYSGLYRAENGQLDPNVSSDFDLKSLMANRFGPLDADRTHQVKAFVSKEFVIDASTSFVVGLTYQGVSGGPINYLASHPSYGSNESFVLPRGSGGRLPWVHDFDGKVGVSYRLTKENVLSVTADVFNLFNFAAPIAVDQTISEGDLLPVTPVAGQSNNDALLTAKKVDANTYEISDVTAKDLNPNFKRVTAYQSPRSVRFGIKVSF
jgi:hypothetical protein